MEKLISLSQFIDENLKTGCCATQLQLIHKYKDFLNQPLTLGMFVPCDLDGNVLEEPNIENDHNDSFFKMQTDFHLEKQYEEAKDKVIFSDFKLSRKPFEDFYYIKNENIFIFKKYCTMKHWSINTKLKNKAVEDLVKYNLVLTESANKQILGS